MNELKSKNVDSEGELGELGEFGDRRFVFMACNPQFQAVCKREVLDRRPEWRLAFSRPGFLTWKIDEELPHRLSLPLTFARTYGWSRESCKTTDESQWFQKIARWIEQLHIGAVHIWNRGWTDDQRRVDQEGDKAVQQCVERWRQYWPSIPVNQTTVAEQRVLDLVRVDPGHWWIGDHVAGTRAQRWPGGIPSIRPEREPVSRSYFKTAEALAWSGMRIAEGDWCAEIGSAPGGSCQRLLELGAHVIAIDPADLDPRVAGHPHLVHLKMRGRDVPHRRLTQVRWLLVDSNVAPKHSLDTVAGLVSGKRTHFRGLLITLKFTDSKMVEQMGSWVKRVKSWGFRYVKTRQLAWGRQEVCLMALRGRSTRRFRR